MDTSRQSLAASRSRTSCPSTPRLLSPQCHPRAAAHTAIVHSVSLIERQQPTSEAAPPQAGCDCSKPPPYQGPEGEGRGELAIVRGGKGQGKLAADSSGMLGLFLGQCSPSDCGLRTGCITSTCWPPPGLSRLGEGEQSLGRAGLGTAALCPLACLGWGRAEAQRDRHQTQLSDVSEEREDERDGWRQREGQRETDKQTGRHWSRGQ